MNQESNYNVIWIVYILIEQVDRNRSKSDCLKESVCQSMKSCKDVVPAITYCRYIKVLWNA